MRLLADMKTDRERNISLRVCSLLADERESQEISQQRLSEMANISRSGLRHIESQETLPTLYSLLKIANALGVDLPDLLKQADSDIK